MKKICISLFALFLFIIGVTPAFAYEERYQVKCEDNKCNIYDTENNKYLLKWEFNTIDFTSKKNIILVSKPDIKGYLEYRIYDIEKQKYLFPKSCAIVQHDNNLFVFRNRKNKIFIYDVIANKTSELFNTEIEDTIRLYNNVFTISFLKNGKYINKIINLNLGKSMEILDCKICSSYKNYFFIENLVGNDIKKGLLNTINFELVIPIKYELIYQNENNYQYVYVHKCSQNNENAGVFDLKEGKWLLEPNLEYEYLVQNLNSKNLPKEIIVKSKNYYGLLNTYTKKLILPIEYERIESFDKISNEILILKKYGKYGLFDINKNEIIYDIKSKTDITTYKGKSPFENIIVVGEGEDKRPRLYDLKTKKYLLPDNAFLQVESEGCTIKDVNYYWYVYGKKRPYKNNKDNIYVYVFTKDKKQVNSNIYNIRTKRYLFSLK